MVYVLISALIGAIMTWFLQDKISDMVKRAGLLTLNYRGRAIPTALGMILLPGTGMASLFFYMYPLISDNIISAFLVLLYGMAAIGLIDDFLGEKCIKGFKGHMFSLAEHRMTTGAFKVGMGAIVSLTGGMFVSNGIKELLINALIIALSANFMNLLDLRPGRCLKGFWLMLLIVSFLWNKSLVDMALFFPLLISTIIYFPLDVKEKGMLGDTGSNFLGAIIGLAVAIGWPLLYKLVYLVMLIIIHVVAERYSFTVLIERSKVLNFIDRMGRIP